MSRTLIMMLAAGLVLASGIAVADEAQPDCEDHQRNDPANADRVSERTAFLRSVQGSGACEGEHWDGQDGTGSTDCGTGVIYLDPNGRIDRAGAYYNSCPDPQKPDLGNGPTDLVHVRAIAQGSPGWKEGDYNVHTGALYVMTDIWGVGTSAVFIEGEQYVLPCIANTNGVCSPNTGSGVGHATVAWYGEDHTDQTVGLTGAGGTADAAYMTVHESVWGDHHGGGAGGNVLASAVHFAHITMGQDVGEESTDCTQSTYEAGDCKRDNTAITVELLA